MYQADDQTLFLHEVTSNIAGTINQIHPLMWSKDWNKTKSITERSKRNLYEQKKNDDVFVPGGEKSDQESRLYEVISWNKNNLFTGIRKM